MSSSTTFEVGRTYQAFWPTDADADDPFTVIARTTKTVVLVDKHGDTRRRRIKHRMGDNNDVEYVLPYGDYSMAARVTADRPAKETR